MSAVLRDRSRTFLPLFAATVTPALIVWAAVQFGVFNAVESQIYDAQARLSASLQLESSSVLLVYSGSDNSAADLKSVISELKSHGAGPIGITIPVPATTAAEISASFPDTVFGSEYFDRATANSLPTASIALAKREGGIYRRHFLRRRVDDGSSALSSLAAELAFRAGATRQTTANSFLIYYRGGRNSLPHISREFVLRGDLVDGLVKGRCILIGASGGVSSLQASTPTTNHGEGMSFLELHGHGLNTLLLNRVVRPIRPWQQFLIFLIAAALGRFLYRSVPARYAILRLVVVAGMAGGIAWILFHWLQIWIPCVPLAAIQMLCCALALNRRLVISSGSLQRILRQRQEQVIAATGKSRVTGTNRWQTASRLADQVVKIRRMALLELPPGSNHLRVAHLVNCTAADIAERRRDYRRPPYLDAADFGEPWLNSYRPFFQQQGAAQDAEFIIPLVHHGAMIGFLIAAIEDSIVEDIESENGENLQHRLGQLARAITERAVVMGNDSDPSKRLRGLGRWMQPSTERALDQQIESAEVFLANHQSLLENVFSNGVNASAICDQHGQVIQTNVAMQSALHQCDPLQPVVAASLSAIDILTRLTGEPFDAWQQRLREVFLDESAISTVLPDKGVKRENPIGIDARLLHVKPIVAKQPTPNATLGVHIEIVDATTIVAAQESKTDLLSHTADELTKRVAALRSLFGSDATPDVLDQCLEQIKRCREMISAPVSNRAEDVLLVDGLAILEQSIASWQHACRTRDVEIALQHHKNHDAGLIANPYLLRSAFDILLEMLIRNAREESAIQISLDATDDHVRLQLQNDGFGTPHERLAQCLSEDAFSDVDSFRNLRKLRSWMEAWSGRLVVRSEIGDGITIELIFQRNLGAISNERSTAASDQDEPSVRDSL